MYLLVGNAMLGVFVGERKGCHGKPSRSEDIHEGKPLFLHHQVAVGEHVEASYYSAIDTA